MSIVTPAFQAEIERARTRMHTADLQWLKTAISEGWRILGRGNCGGPELVRVEIPARYRPYWGQPVHDFLASDYDAMAQDMPPTYHECPHCHQGGDAVTGTRHAMTCPQYQPHARGAAVPNY